MAVAPVSTQAVRARVDLDLRHPAQIDDDPAFRGAVADDAVTTAAHGELIAFISCGRYDATHIRDIGDANDRGRPFVDAAVEHGAGLIVRGIFGHDDTSLDLGEAGGRGTCGLGRQ